MRFRPHRPPVCRVKAVTPQRSRVCWRPVHSDAVQTGVLWVSPVGRHLDFHHLEGSVAHLLSQNTTFAPSAPSAFLKRHMFTGVLNHSRLRRRSGQRLRPGRSCRHPAAGLSPGSHHPNPGSKPRPLSVSNRKQAPGAARTHVNAEVSGGAVHLPAWCQSFGGVLQGDGSREDGHGEPDYQVTAGTSEGPTVSRIHVRLEFRSRRVNSVVRVNRTPPPHPQRNLVWSDLYLDHSSRRLREIPERKSEEAEQSHLRPVGLRATGDEDAAPCRTGTDMQLTGDDGK